MVNPKSSVGLMTSQQLRAYFRETQDEDAFREILSRGLEENDKVTASAFKAWQEKRSLKLPVQFIEIDGSKISDRTNPWPEIYEQIREQGCLEWDREPSNLAQMKRYWNEVQRNSQKVLTLVFHIDHDDQNPDDFDKSFLRQLSSFEGKVALISDRPTQTKLQTFSPNQPDLRDAILEWARNSSGTT